MTWPQRIEGNMFGVCKFDPEKPMTLKVNTWSNVFSSGGSVNIDGYDAEGQRYHTSFAKINVEGGSVLREREHLQGIVDDFNEDLAENWRALVLDARARVLEYERRQLSEAAEKVAKYEKGEWS